MTLYEFLLFVHVLAAAAWVGAVLFVALVTELALRSNDRSTLVKLVDYDERLAPLLYIPAVLLVSAAGIGMVLDGPWSFGDGWILTGIALLVVTFILGVGLIVPASKKLAVAVEGAGVESEDAHARLQVLRTLTWIDLGLLVAAFFVMTTKPF
jgi:uncharacterized membrane protein